MQALQVSRMRRSWRTVGGLLGLQTMLPPIAQQCNHLVLALMFLSCPALVCFTCPRDVLHNHNVHKAGQVNLPAAWGPKLQDHTLWVGRAGKCWCQQGTSAEQERT